MLSSKKKYLRKNKLISLKVCDKCQAQFVNVGHGWLNNRSSDQGSFNY